jgi:hypothetical protein
MDPAASAIVPSAALAPIAAHVRSVHGKVTWGYFEAARLQGLTLVRTSLIPEAWRLRGAVLHVDALKIRQRPLMFVLPHQRGEWRWPIQDVDIQAGQITAALGPAAP